MSEIHEPGSRPILPGVAGLADRPVDGRRVSLVMGLVGLALALGAGGGVEHLLAGANAPTDGGEMLHDLAPEPPPSARAPGRAAVILVDGMRVDEARALPSWDRLGREAVTGVLALDAPTLSRPFYHQLLTGVPPDASGVRSNRFDGPARHPSVADSVRAARGRVLFVADGLDWMRRMHGRPGDGGSDAAGALERPLDDAIAAWRGAPLPALLVVHTVNVDRSAHDEGIHGPAHRAALEEADRVIARLAPIDDAALFVLSDHGHREAGGHGGLEPEVARAPLLVRAPGLASTALEAPVDPSSLAASIAWWLGVARPREAVAASDPRLALEPSSDPWPPRAEGLVEGGRRAGLLRLGARRGRVLPLVLVFLVLSLGPIKRAFGFDRSVPVAIALWPLLALGLHLALGGPLSLSAIDGKLSHALRIASIGGLAALATYGVARLLAPAGDARTTSRRAASTVGWAALAWSALPAAWVGFALGPWPLRPSTLYVPLFALGAGGAALATAAVLLFVTLRAESKRPAG